MVREVRRAGKTFRLTVQSHTPPVGLERGVLCESDTKQRKPARKECGLSILISCKTMETLSFTRTTPRKVGESSDFQLGLNKMEEGGSLFIIQLLSAPEEILSGVFIFLLNFIHSIVLSSWCSFCTGGKRCPEYRRISATHPLLAFARKVNENFNLFPPVRLIVAYEWTNRISVREFQYFSWIRDNLPPNTWINPSSTAD